MELLAKKKLVNLKPWLESSKDCSNMHCSLLEKLNAVTFWTKQNMR